MREGSVTYVNVNRIELSISQPEIYLTKSVIPNTTHTLLNS